MEATVKNNANQVLTANVVALCCAIIMALAFIAAPWTISTVEDAETEEEIEVSVSGIGLFSLEESPIPTGLLWLIPLAAVGGGFFAFRAVTNHQDKLAIRLIAIAGLVGLVYYLSLLVGEPAEDTATGFWVAMFAALLMCFSFFVPRPIQAKHNFLMPAVIWVLVFTAFPLVYSLYLSTTNFRLGRDPEFIGLENYSEIFGFECDEETIFCEWSADNVDERALNTAGFTAFLAIGSTILTVLAGTFIAWIFNHDLPFLKQMRAIITMPLFAAPVALGFLGIVIFNEQAGPINNILQGLGLPRVQWFVDPWGARFAILLTDVWQWTPFVFIVVLAAMQGIPDDLYESARLDSKSDWMLFRWITFPMISPALGTVALLRLVETFKVIDVPYSLTRGGPGSVTQTYSYHAYITGLVGSFQLGEASALAYLLVIVAIIVTTIYFVRVSDRFD